MRALSLTEPTNTSIRVNETVPNDIRAMSEFSRTALEGGIGSASDRFAGFPLTDEEAVELLRGANSGLRPDLSRLGYRLVKRSFDIVASGAAVAALLVPGLVLSAVICAKSPGAGPLYSQLRVGRLRKDGSYRLFRMWKFRSMVPRADEMLEGLRDRNEADGPLFKIYEADWSCGSHSGWSGEVSERAWGWAVRIWYELRGWGISAPLRVFFWRDCDDGSRLVDCFSL